MVRYEIHERLYLHVNRETTNNLEEALVGLYVLVLLFLVRAKRFYTKSSTSECSVDNERLVVMDYSLCIDYLQFEKADFV